MIDPHKVHLCVGRDESGLLRFKCGRKGYVVFSEARYYFYANTSAKRRCKVCEKSDSR